MPSIWTCTVPWSRSTSNDGEGELLSRVRAVVGPDIPVVASLDLHANVTQRMLEHADVLIAYRTYPHIDMAETGARVARFLQRRLADAPRPRLSARRVPFLIPLQTQCTMLEPAKSIYEELARLEDGSVASLSFAPGFPAADFPECGPTVIAYAEDPAAASRVADALRDAVQEHESAFDCPVYTPEEGVRRAIALAAHASRPVVIADTQDNPGCGRRIGHHRYAACAGGRKRAARGARTHGRSGSREGGARGGARRPPSRSPWAASRTSRATHRFMAASS